MFRPFGAVLSYAYQNLSNSLRDHMGVIKVSNVEERKDLYITNIQLGRCKLTFHNGQLKEVNGAPVLHSL